MTELMLMLFVPAVDIYGLQLFLDCKFSKKSHVQSKGPVNVRHFE